VILFAINSWKFDVWYHLPGTALLCLREEFPEKFGFFAVFTGKILKERLFVKDFILFVLVWSNRRFVVVEIPMRLSPHVGESYR
jgi:hypothetical protein